MEFTKKASYIRQLSLYIRYGDQQKAYFLSKDFVERFPQETCSHFLCAEAAFSMGNYEEAAIEGRKAFNMSKCFDDMLIAALVTSSAYLKRGQYKKGYQLLKEMEKHGHSEELESALIVFCLALSNQEDAMVHFRKLYNLNEKMATEFASRMAGSYINP